MHRGVIIANESRNAAINAMNESMVYLRRC